MKIILRQATIHDKSSVHDNSCCDVLIQDGIIQEISSQILEQADAEVTHPDLHVSNGWVDIFTFIGQPGYEHRETLKSGAAAAQAGGFTDIFMLPNTSPVISTHAQVSYLTQQSKLLPVNILPLGSVTAQTEGKALSEMYDMYKAGAVAFSEGLQTLENTGIMLKALQYLKTIDGTIIQVPGDKTIAPHGLVNEGITSTLMGLPGKPAIAEEICVARDIELLRYTGSRLHITGISTKVSLELIKNARIEGLHLTCSVTPYHVFFCEEDLAGYNTNLKLNPPLRTRKDMMALRAGLNAGEIDCIASHHLPVHADKKDCEFEYASYGMSNLEATYSAVNTIMEENPGKLAQMMADKPREIFNLPRPSIEIGQEAVLTLFAPGETYTFSEKNILSHAHNNPFLGHTLKGRVLGTVFRQILHLNAHD